MKVSVFRKGVHLSLSFILVVSLFLGYLVPGAHAAPKDPIPTESGPRDIDYHNGYVYAAHRNLNKITRTKLADSSIETVVTHSTNAYFVPMSVALNSAGDLFYTRDSDINVYKIPAAGLPVDVSTTAPVVYATLTGTNFLYATAFDSEGNLYVANNSSNPSRSIVKVAPGGSPVTTIVSGFTRTVVGLTFSQEGDLYIQDDWNKFYIVSSDDLASGSGASYEEITGVPSIPSNGGLATLPDGSIIYSAGNTFNYLDFVFPQRPPGIELASDPIVLIDPNRINDTVSVIASVYSLGSKPVLSRGVEYRPYKDEGTETWIQKPYEAGNPNTKGSFTTVLTGLQWHKKYELRGYASSEVGTAYTDIKRFIMDNDGSVIGTDLRFDRVGPNVLHIRDKKRIVAVGVGITNLLRKPLSEASFSLRNGSSVTPLTFNIVNNSQVELFWEADLAPGTYEVHLNHATFPSFVIADNPATEEFEGLTIVNTDFYKPRNFDSIEVPSTSPSSGNDLSVLKVQGPFRELPTAPGLYTLNDPNEVVTLNGNVLFKGSSLQVDKTGADGKTVVRGDGRLFVNASIQGATAPYTLYEGPFSFTSDQFSLASNGGEAVDYLRLNMPFKTSSLTFVKGGVNLAGQLELGFTAGNQKVSGTIPIEALQYRNNRFELIGTYTLNKSFKLGPIDASDTKFVIDSRFPFVSLTGKAGLPGTNIVPDLYMDLKQGRLDGFGIDTFKKANFASTGLQIDYLFGGVDNLAGKTQIPQRFRVDGSVTDVLVPQLKHPSATYKFNLLGTDNIDVDVTPYGLEASGIEYYYWLAVKDMNLQAVVNPAIAGIKGFSSQGFLASGTLNAFDVIKGKIAATSFNKKGYNGAVKATVYVPKGIPRIGGATVRDVTLSVGDKQIIGVFKHNGIGARVSYTFANNTIFFEVEAEPPKKSWWEKALGFLEAFDDFMDSPLGQILEEVFLYRPAGDEGVLIASAGDLSSFLDARSFAALAASNPSGEMKRVYDLKGIAVSGQPEFEAEKDALARIADGQLTAVERTPRMTATTNAGGLTFSFAAERDFDALFVLSGDQSSAVLTGKSGGAAKAETEAVYAAGANKTLLRASLKQGEWTLSAGEGSRVDGVYELLYVNPSLTSEQLAETWARTPERQVAVVRIPARGDYALTIRGADGEPIVYKPDGRPYELQTEENLPGWNAFRDADGAVRSLIAAAEAGTWLIVAEGNPSIRLGGVPSDSTTSELKSWTETGTYPVAFELDRTQHGQAVVEIYGTGATTKLIMPNGELYPFQPDSSKNGMNVSYDEAERKMTVLLNGVELKGQWKAVGDGFAGVVAYSSSRKFKSIKPLVSVGRYTRSFVVEEKGDYMLSIGGGSRDTVVLDPKGKVYALNFSEPGGNAYLQPASDRMPQGPSTGGDPVDRTEIVTPAPALDGRDMLYVTLTNAAAGKWQVQNETRAELDVRKLIPLPEVRVTVEPLSGADNRIRVNWSTEHAAPGTEATVMLTDGADSVVGETLAEGLPASGSEVFSIPAETIPGSYSVSVMATSAEEAPAYGLAEGAIEVQAPYALAAPGVPEVTSTGNGEVALQFASTSGQVERYRIWIGEGSEGQPATPYADIEPQSGSVQQAVVSGLPVDADYTVAVSAIGRQDDRLVLSPLTDAVSLTLPAPSPATLGIGLKAGASPTAERAYQAYDGSAGALLVTAAEQAKLTVTPNQSATLSLTVDGHTFAGGRTEANVAKAFDLNELLETAVLEEREYVATIEATNDRGDRTLEYRRIVFDRMAPLLIASGENETTGALVPLNGTVDGTGKVKIVGQTETGAELSIGGVRVPTDDEGRFVYYAPLDWSAGSDRLRVEIRAVDAAGNTTAYGFEALKDNAGPWSAYPDELAALTTGDATMSAPYRIGTTSYEASAASNKVRVYAVPMAATSSVTIDGRELSAEGFVEVDVPDGGKTVTIAVLPAGGGAAKSFSLRLGNGSSAALLGGLTLKKTSGETIPARELSGMEETYSVYADSSVDEIVLAPSAWANGSEITVDGQIVQSGHSSQPIALTQGENVIQVTVRSPDRTATRDYQVVVWREASGEAELRQLGILTAGATLAPEFDPGAEEYRLLLPIDATELKLQPVPQDSGAVAFVNGQDASVGAVTLPFEGESLTVAIEVRAADESERTYVLNVVRKKATPGAAPVLDRLEAGVALSGEFAPYKLNYGAKNQTSSATMTVKAIAVDPLSSVTVMGVTLQGGGDFSPRLENGRNTIRVQVESADRTASRTYSIEVTKTTSGGSGGGVPAEIERQSTITGGGGKWTVKIPIVRTRSQDGTAIDTMKLDAEKAREMLNEARRNDDKSARIQMTDLPNDPAGERFVRLSAGALALLAGDGLSLRIELPEAVVDLDAEALKGLAGKGQDAYFRVVPVPSGDGLDGLTARARKADSVGTAAGDLPVALLGRPVKIETNYTGFRTGLLFLFDGAKDNAASFEKTGVYIEHSDGEKKFVPGELRYDAEGRPIGIEIEISKFSSFVPLGIGGNESASATLQPYLKGYSDGTFRPSNAIKRAEFASLLYRLGLTDGMGDKMQASGYPDVTASYWAAEAIASAQRSGLMRGDGQGRFRPNADMTRAEMASIVARLLASEQAKTDGKAVPSDAKGHWASEAIAKTLQAGIMQGLPGGLFGPDRTLTRAETVRVLNKLTDRPTADAATPSWPDVPRAHWAFRDIESASGIVTESEDGTVRIVPRNP